MLLTVKIFPPAQNSNILGKEIKILLQGCCREELEMIENAQKNDSKVLAMGSSIRGVSGIHKTQFMSCAVCLEEAGKEIKILLQRCCPEELEMIENAQKNDSKVLEMGSSIRGVSRIHKTQFMSCTVCPEEA